MIDNTPLLDLISYDELSHILNDKFKSTPQELRYWIKKSLYHAKECHKRKHIEDEGLPFFLEELEAPIALLFPYASDLPNMGMYEYPPDDFFYPECYFYDRQAALTFIPYPSVRFVYQRNLTAHRNWNDYKIKDSHSLVGKTLLNANEYGILRFYNHKIDEFTLHANKSQLWSNTFEGESYISDPDSFFLLYEILNIERIFFKRNRDECLRELELPIDPLPKNVYKFNKK